MKKLLIVLAGIAALLVVTPLTACSPAATLSITRGEMEQAEDDSGGIITRQLELKAGDRFDVVLYAHRSAGLEWSAIIDDSGIVRRESRKFTSDAPPDTDGGPGHEEWSFKALTEGTAIIKMTYKTISYKAEAPFVANTLIIEVLVSRD